MVGIRLEALSVSFNTSDRVFVEGTKLCVEVVLGLRRVVLATTHFDRGIREVEYSEGKVGFDEDVSSPGVYLYPC